MIAAALDLSKPVELVGAFALGIGAAAALVIVLVVLAVMAWTNNGSH